VINKSSLLISDKKLNFLPVKVLVICQFLGTCLELQMRPQPQGNPHQENDSYELLIRLLMALVHPISHLTHPHPEPKYVNSFAPNDVRSTQITR